ncbi:hypothetical protein FACS1894211_16760 [Clostridia bacterium]|nr:hypothetical protein FACS1894211_16760 [Clostridia bacterium]
MSIIRYEFNDGTVNEIEVSGELYAVHEQLLQQEKRNHWRNTRRHVSLNYLNENGIDFEDIDGDCLTALIKQEDNEMLHNAIAGLPCKQRELVERVFFENMTTVEIAKIEGVTQSAISHRFAAVFKKLKKLL